MAGRGSSDNDECFDFEEYDDGESFDRMVEGIRERTSDENERTSLLTSKIPEDFVWSDALMDKRNGTDDRQEAETRSFSSNSKRRGKRSVEPGRMMGKRRKGRAQREKRRLQLGLDLSDHIKARIGKEGDKDFKFRMMTQILETDLKKHNDRFSMPSNQINKDFEAMDIRKTGKEVVLVELDLGVDVHQRTMNLRLWEMNNSFSYMLTSSWNDVLSRNEGRLNANDIVLVNLFLQP
ncbi:hypothetical protein POTOM_018607 [Populus tomentosa]|uniref:B3 domain-containing protein n=1 Tax=Populus tomentosa TaxID=118781 RepID=A0A8X8CTH3_POPTO|nr:hypothetical protein POTOM_018607 [Populus tomentosa]